MQQWCGRGIGPAKRFYTKPWCVAEPFGKPILKHRGLTSLTNDTELLRTVIRSGPSLAVRNTLTLAGALIVLVPLHCGFDRLNVNWMPLRQIVTVNQNGDASCDPGGCDGRTDRP
jgi:hypothetical protein